MADVRPNQNRKRPRIALLICELMMGGAARVVRDHAAAFREFADIVEVVFDKGEGVDFAGGDVLSLDVEGGSGSVGKVAALATRVRRYDAIKGQREIDVSVSHLEGAHYVDLLGSNTVKRVVVVHGSILGNEDIRGLTGLLRRRILIPWLYRRADIIVTVSRDIERELRSIGLTKVRTINNFFNIEDIERSASVPLSEDERLVFEARPTLVTVGRLADQKKHAGLIDAIAALKSRRPTSLVMLGDGPLRAALIDQCRQLGLDTWTAWDGAPLRPGCDVYFMGVDSNPFRFVRHADLFVLPSGWEGFPLALCEAMACGAPVVSTDCPTGAREILAPETNRPDSPISTEEVVEFGVLMPLLHPRTTADAARDVWVRTLERMLDDEPLRAGLGSAGRQRVEDFSRERIVMQWRRLYEELLWAG